MLESKICDGVNQCEDKSDEEDCPCAYNGELKQVRRGILNVYSLVDSVYLIILIVTHIQYIVTSIMCIISPK